MNQPSNQPGTRKTSQPCQICHQVKAGMVPAVLVRPAVIDEITKVHPDFSLQGYICAEDLNHFRFEYVQKLLSDETW